VCVQTFGAVAKLVPAPGFAELRGDVGQDRAPTVQSMTFGLVHRGAAPFVGHYRIEEVPPTRDTTWRTVGLSGLPPGTPVSGSLVLQPEVPGSIPYTAGANSPPTSDPISSGFG
jgi:hypothetical protein